MIVIGADTHKSTQALAAVDAGTGQVVGEREIAGTTAGTARRFSGRANSTRMWCGPWRTAGMYPTISSARS
jgi:hypothetical protein